MALGRLTHKAETENSGLIIRPVTLVKVLAKALITVILDGGTNPAHQFLEVIQIVDSVQASTQNLTAFVEMAQVSS
jgi:hypothetical protein